MGKRRHRFHQEIEAIVELVVAQRSCIITNGIHRGDDRVQIALFHPPLIGDVIAHGVALQKIAVVQQKRVGRLGADVSDMGGGAGQTDGIDRFVRVIIIGKDVHVQIGGFHQPQMRLPGGGTGRKRMDHHQGRACDSRA